MFLILMAPYNYRELLRKQEFILYNVYLCKKSRSHLIYFIDFPPEETPPSLQLGAMVEKNP